MAKKQEEEVKDSQVEDTTDATEDEDESPSVSADDEGGVTVRLPEKTRKERRRDRSKERYEELASEVKRYKDEIERVRREAEEARQLAYRAATERPHAAPARQEEDPYKRELEQIRREQESIQTAFRLGSVSDQSEVERMRKRFYELDDRREELRIEAIERRISSKIPERREGEYEEQILRNEFPEVVNHPQALQYAVGEYNRLVAKGKPRTLATSREAMTIAAKEFGFVQQTAPPVPETQRMKYGGVPAQAGARTAPTEMRLTQAQMRMARAAYPSDDDETAAAKWAAMYQRELRKESQQGD